MRVLLCIVALCLGFTSAARGEPSITITRMSCADVKAAVKKNGAIILRYRSARDPGLPLYARYVSDSRFCDSRQTAVFASVPTADKKNCPVRKCEQIY